MIERKRHKLQTTIHVEPQDMLVCTVQDRQTNKEHLFQEIVGRQTEIDTIVTFDLDEPILGLSSGFGGIFGKSL